MNNLFCTRSIKGRAPMLFLTFVACLFQLPHQLLHGQSAHNDSLLAKWNDRGLPDSSRIKSLLTYADETYMHTKPDSAFILHQQAFELADTAELPVLMSHAKSSQGISYAIRGNVDSALVYFHSALSYSEAAENPHGIASDLGNLGNIYSMKGDYATAIDFYNKSIDKYEEINDKEGAASCLMSIANLMQEQKEYDRANEYYETSLNYANESDLKYMAATIHANIGVIQEQLGDDSSSLKHHFMSMQLKEETGRTFLIPVSEYQIGHLYNKIDRNKEARTFLEKSLSGSRLHGDLGTQSRALAELSRLSLKLKDNKSAVQFGEEALSLAEQSGSLSNIESAAETLYQVYKANGNSRKALAMHETLVTAQDSIYSEENKKRVIQQGFKYEYEKKEALAQAEQEKKDALAERNLQRQKLMRNGALGGFGVMMVFTTIFFVQRNRIRKGKALSDSLLLNILPAAVAEELKANGSAEAKHFSNVTVLFTDFKEFTEISEQLTPEELVKEIDTCFRAFDEITHKYHIEKIKTIGDAYMAAGGLPVPNATNAVDVVQAAIEIRDFILERSLERALQGKMAFGIRIGIHTGPVVAGIVGIKKFQYDIWGDTVNTASRMESTGEPGKVNISESTYQLVKEQPAFKFTSRGTIDVKGKGTMNAYFVDSSAG